MSGKITFAITGPLAAVCILCGCSSLPDGEVPPSLVGETVRAEEDLLQKDAEAAMCGAVVRSFVRLGHGSDRTPLAFTKDSSPQRKEFVSLLTGTNMIWFCGEDSAKYLLDSKLEDGIWTLKMLKKDGTVIFSKTVRYH